MDVMVNGDGWGPVPLNSDDTRRRVRAHRRACGPRSVCKVFVCDCGQGLMGLCESCGIELFASTIVEVRIAAACPCCGQPVGQSRCGACRQILADAFPTDHDVGRDPGVIAGKPA